MLRVLYLRTNPPPIAARVIIQDAWNSGAKSTIIPWDASFNHFSQSHLNARWIDDRLQVCYVVKFRLSYKRVLLPEDFPAIERWLNDMIELAIRFASEKGVRWRQVLPEQQIDVCEAVFVAFAAPRCDQPICTSRITMLDDFEYQVWCCWLTLPEKELNCPIQVLVNLFIRMDWSIRNV